MQVFRATFCFHLQGKRWNIEKHSEQKGEMRKKAEDKGNLMEGI